MHRAKLTTSRRVRSPLCMCESRAEAPAVSLLFLFPPYKREGFRTSTLPACRRKEMLPTTNAHRPPCREVIAACRGPDSGLRLSLPRFNETLILFLRFRPIHGIRGRGSTRQGDVASSAAVLTRVSLRLSLYRSRKPPTLFLQVRRSPKSSSTEPREGDPIAGCPKP